jgi:DNA-binding GntR family transcriptional regulator
MKKDQEQEIAWIKTDTKVPPTIRETIYKHIKEAIFNGKLSPGQKLTERNIAKAFNISSGPVREAFQKLAAEKFLTINARKEVHIAFSTLDEVKEMVEFVIELDLIAVKKALKWMDDETIDELRKMTQKLGDMSKSKNKLAYSKQNIEIHKKIWKTAGNPYLYEALLSHHEKLLILANYFVFSRKPQCLATSYQSHVDLFEIFEQRNRKNATKIIKTHWNWIIKFLT